MHLTLRRASRHEASHEQQPSVRTKVASLARRLGDTMLGGPLSDEQRARREEFIARYQRADSAWGTEPGQHPFTFDPDELPYYERDSDQIAA